MMEVCIIGCGNQGGCFAALLAMEPNVDRVVVADLDIARANHVKELILAMGGKAAQTRIDVDTVDATDHADVARVAKGTQFIFNGILPFCNLAVMKGALLAGAHYMDLYAMSSDLEGMKYEETIEAQLAMNEDFKQAGLTAFPSGYLPVG
jgi:saccharopine dehydrogenase-like NADP-dependent oxidoreductase